MSTPTTEPCAAKLAPLPPGAAADVEDARMAGEPRVEQVVRESARVAVPPVVVLMGIDQRAVARFTTLAR